MEHSGMKVDSLTLVKLVDLIFASKSSQMKFKKRVRSDLNIILIQYYTTKQLTVQEFINDVWMENNSIVEIWGPPGHRGDGVYPHAEVLHAEALQAGALHVSFVVFDEVVLGS